MFLNNRFNGSIFWYSFLLNHSTPEKHLLRKFGDKRCGQGPLSKAKSNPYRQFPQTNRCISRSASRRFRGDWTDGIRCQTGRLFEYGDTNPCLVSRLTSVFIWDSRFSSGHYRNMWIVYETKVAEIVGTLVKGKWDGRDYPEIASPLSGRCIQVVKGRQLWGKPDWI